MNTQSHPSWFGLLALAAACTFACSPPQNGGAARAAGATKVENPDGWRVLFDGSTTAEWRNFRGEGVNPAWKIEDGALVLAGDGAGDLITVDEFENFELAFEWRISEGGNSGVFFNVVEGDHDWVWRTGPEYQLLDNEGHSDGEIPSHRAGANFDLDAPSVDAAMPVGEFNQSRLIVNRGHVEHWLNGQRVVEYDLWTPEWEAKVAASKFAAMPAYGRARAGHIALQDHGDRVWFREIKIRPL